ncbi:MAG: flavodoxin [Candidatus Bathyarchaeota archaeon]|nr:flavodoxin [Candidatus Bathyarchaeota archaeon]
MKAVVVYFSVSGNTRFVAEKIADELKADLCKVTDNNYKQSRLLYLRGGLAALRKKTSEIELSTPVEGYDLVIAGTPVWAGKVAPAIRTFLENKKPKESQVAFFVTLGGDKPQKTLEDMREIVQPKVPVGELGVTKPLDNKEETERQVKEWSSQIQKTLK